MSEEENNIFKIEELLTTLDFENIEVAYSLLKGLNYSIEKIASIITRIGRFSYPYINDKMEFFAVFPNKKRVMIGQEIETFLPCFSEEEIKFIVQRKYEISVFMIGDKCSQLLLSNKKYDDFQSYSLYRFIILSDLIRECIIND